MTATATGCRHADAGEARAGTTLIELLVALPLTVLVAVLAVSLLLHVGRTARGQGARLATARELRHARLVLSRELEALHGTDIQTLNDSLLEFRAHLGILVLCAASSATEVEVAAVDDAPRSGWLAGVRAGDDFEAWAMPSAATDLPQRWRGQIVQPPTTMSISTCGPAPGAPARRRWRLTLASAPGVPLVPGMPVAIGRPVRYRHYQSGSQWWLGRRTRDAAGWDVTQPVAGPLLSYRDAGMQVRGFTREGVDTALPDSLALIRITLRAPRRLHDARSAMVDSAVFEVALRAAPAHRASP